MFWSEHEIGLPRSLGFILLLLIPSLVSHLDSLFLYQRNCELRFVKSIKIPRSLAVLLKLQRSVYGLATFIEGTQRLD
jgi:hypothetical protein